MTQAGEARRDKIVTYLRHSEGPSIREIAVAVDLHTTCMVVHHLKILRARGVVTWNTVMLPRARTLRLTETRIPGTVDGRPGWWTPEVRA